MATIDGDVLRKLADAIMPKRASSTVSTRATVTSVDPDGTTWVRIDGADEDTPVNGNIIASAQVGDEVMLGIGGGSASVTGNVDSPAVGTREASSLRTNIIQNMSLIKVARTIADQAAAVAAATGQRFWASDDGVHVTNVEKETFETEPQGPNILINSLGLLLRTALANLVSITEGATAFYDGNDNEAENITAMFGEDGFQVGKENESHLVGDYHSLQLVDREGDTYFHVSDLRDASGELLLVETFEGDGSRRYFFVAFEVSTEVSAVDSSDPTNTAECDGREYTFENAPASGAVVTITYKTASQLVKAYTLGNRASGSTAGAMSVAEGYQTEASGAYSHAENHGTVASGYSSHAENDGTTASGFSSHAEGRYTTASGENSHAEGYQTNASREYSHAEGNNATANGAVAHAEGFMTTASGRYSHAQNCGATATKDSQTALGSYNIKDESSTTTHPSGSTYYGQYALIIGNGTGANARSNAMMVQWDGTIMNVSGNLTKDTAVSAATAGKDIVFLDSALKTIGCVGPYFHTSNREGMRFGTTRTVNGTVYGHWMYIYVDNAGKREVHFTDGTAWRNGLGASSGIWPASLGGTGSDSFGTIETDDISTAVSVATATWKAIGSVTLGAGDWIVSYNSYFAINATGRRGMLIHTTADTTSTNSLRQGGVEVMAVNGGVTMLNGCRVLHLTAASTTYYLNVMQSSGANLNVTGYIRAFRLK